jgi:hypothetical protein
MESPTIWVSFLRVPKSSERGDGGYAGFLGGDGSPCNIGFLIISLSMFGEFDLY